MSVKRSAVELRWDMDEKKVKWDQIDWVQGSRDWKTWSSAQMQGGRRVGTREQEEKIEGYAQRVAFGT